MNPEKLVRMVNQIAEFFAHEGPERAPSSIADHLKKFWDPRMRAELLAAASEGRAVGLVPNAQAAITQLAGSQNPAP